MRALVFDGHKLALDEHYPTPRVRRGQALIRVVLASDLVVNEIQVIGSRCGSMRIALEALARGNIKVEPLIDAVLPLSSGCAGFRIAVRKEALKILVRM